VQANADMLSRLARVSAVELAAATLSGNNARSTSVFDVAVVYERQIDVPAERERLTKDLAKYTKGLEAAELIAQHPAATTDREANAARRDAMRNLLYRRDS